MFFDERNIGRKPVQGGLQEQLGSLQLVRELLIDKYDQTESPKGARGHEEKIRKDQWRWFFECNRRRRCEEREERQRREPKGVDQKQDLEKMKNEVALVRGGTS